MRLKENTGFIKKHHDNNPVCFKKLDYAVLE